VFLTFLVINIHLNMQLIAFSVLNKFLHSSRYLNNTDNLEHINGLEVLLVINNEKEESF